MKINNTITKYANNPLFKVTIGYDYEKTHTYYVYVNTSEDDPNVVPSYMVDHFEVPVENIQTYEEAFVMAQYICRINNLDFAGDCGSCPRYNLENKFLLKVLPDSFHELKKPKIAVCFNNKDKNGFFLYAFDEKENSTPAILGGYYLDFKECTKDALILSEKHGAEFVGLKQLCVHNYTDQLVNAI